MCYPIFVFGCPRGVVSRRWRSYKYHFLSLIFAKPKRMTLWQSANGLAYCKRRHDVLKARSESPLFASASITYPKSWSISFYLLLLLFFLGSLCLLVLHILYPLISDKEKQALEKPNMFAPSPEKKRRLTPLLPS